MGKLKEVKIEPNAKCIETAEALLDMALTGKVQGFAIVTINTEFKTGSAFVNIGERTMAVLGDLECLKYDIIRTHVDTRT